MNPHEVLDGLLLIDKAPSRTSFQVVKGVKRLLGAKKVGHTGTLDPLATGLLAICIGKATKLSPIIMTYQKEYDVWARFGVATDSHDRTGEVIAEKPWGHINEAMLQEAILKLTGKVVQVPPMFSAVKYKGRPLYWYAHQGIVLNGRKERTVHIREFKLIDWQPPRARFIIKCSHGTYVRTLINDLAQSLDSVGVVDELRRNACGRLHVDNALKLDQFAVLNRADQRAAVLTMSEALDELPRLCVASEMARRIRHGRPVFINDLDDQQRNVVEQDQRSELGKLFRMVDPAGSLLAVASVGKSPFLEKQPVHASKLQTLRLF